LKQTKFSPILSTFGVLVLCGLFSIPSFAQVGDNPPVLTISTELPLYDQGDTVIVSGFITNLDVNNAIDITLRIVGPITSSNSGTIVSITQIKPNPDGSFENSIGIVWTQRGDYKIIANYGPNKAETTFFYTGETTSSITDDAYVKTAKSYYAEGEAIIISGKADSFLPNTPLLIQVFHDAIRVHIAQVEVAQDGTFTYSLIADGPNFQTPGEYVVQMSYGVTGNVYETSFDFQTNDSTITDPIIVVTDEDHYSVGDTVSIFGEVGERLSGYDVNVQVISANGNLVTSQQIPVLDDNTFELELIADGPLWRASGTYTIKVLYGTATRSAETTFEFNSSSQQLPTTISVSIPTGSSTPSCADADNCFIPSDVAIASGGEVVWSNDDSASHTVTSGYPNSGPDGKFDSGLFLSGQTFTHIFDEKGEFPYFCLVHPWMQGTIFVGQGIPNPNPVPTPPPDTNLPSDVTVVMVKGTASNQDCADRCYMPNIVSVAAGGKVTWNNVDSAAHTATATDGSFDTSLVNAGSTASHTFRNVGTYPYMCILHPWMKGTVIVGQGIPNPNPTPDIELFVNVDKSEYDLGELATLNVQISDVSSSQNVAITVTDPFGTVMVSRTLTTDSNGNASTDFKIAESFKTGTYRIDATSLIDGWTYLDDSEFRVTSQFNQIQIISAQGTDQQGNPMEFSRGNMGFVKVQVNAQKPIATLITVNVFDSDLTPLGVGSLKTTLNTGQSELILSFMIPQDAVVGTADIYVNALSDWVSAGGIPQTGEFAGQVRIN